MHSEQKKCEDNLIQGGGGGGDSGYLFLTLSEFFKFTIRNCIEFVSYQKMKTFFMKPPIGEAKQRSSSCWKPHPFHQMSAPDSVNIGQAEW